MYKGETESPLLRNRLRVWEGRKGGRERAKNVAGVRPEGLQQALAFLACISGSPGEACLFKDDLSLGKPEDMMA